jgi:hypothetical protein
MASHINKLTTTPGRRLTTYATYDRPHLRPQKFKFFCDPILFAICTSKITNQAAARTITMGAFTVFKVQYVQYYFTHYVQYNYKFKRL